MEPPFGRYHESIRKINQLTGKVADQWQSAEFVRGVFANWWQQGVDSVATWNWSNARAKVCRKMGCQPGPTSQETALRDVGSVETLRFKNKIFAVDRRGGFPWSEGYFSRNEDAPLPLNLSNGDSSAQIPIRIGDRLSDHAEAVKALSLRLIAFGAANDDELEARLNGEKLEQTGRAADHKDNQILSPAPQPNSGRLAQRPIDRNQKLLRLDLAIPPSICRVGMNEVTVRLTKKSPSRSSGQVKLEKVEVHIEYAG